MNPPLNPFEIRAVARTMNSLRWIALVCALGVVPTAAHAQLRTFDNLRPLLIEAIRLGDSKGILGGVAAEMMEKTFGATEPIIVTMRRVRFVEPDGCARIEVTTTQANVREPKIFEPAPGQPTHNPPTELKTGYEINFCENGRFPEEGGGRL